MQLQIGDRLTDETGENEVFGWPYTIASCKTPVYAFRKSAVPRATSNACP